MVRTLRYLAILFIIGPFGAMVAQPFFEAVFDQLGWVPEDWAGPTVTALFELFARPWFRYLSVATFGVGVGVWLSWLATRFDRRRAVPRAERELATRLAELYAEGTRSRNNARSTAISDQGQYDAARKRLVEWSGRVEAVLDDPLVAVAERSDFTTLGGVQVQRRDNPLSAHIDAMWNEKLARLHRIIARIGGRDV